MVYYNLHKHCLSVKAMEGPLRGRVILHAYAVQLQDAVFKVSQAGRERVLRERAKNVHAGVIGKLVAHETANNDTRLAKEALELGMTRLLTYDPYRFTSFVDRDTFEPVHAAPACVIVGRKILTPPVTTTSAY